MKVEGEVMVVNEENTNPPVAKKFDWKIIAGLGVAVIVLAYILFRFFVFVNERSVNNFEGVLASYYEALSSNDTNAITKFVTSDFVNEAGDLNTQSGKTEVFSYKFENLDQVKNPQVLTNSENTLDQSISKITYSVTSGEGNSRMSCLMEAYFALENGQPKIQYLKKIYKGRNIVR
jgi:hypothetical protein